MSCGDRMCGDGGYVEDTGGSGDVRRVWDSGVDLDVLYCEDADLEGWVAEGMDADKAINPVIVNGNRYFRSGWLNEYGDLLVCEGNNTPLFSCGNLYYIRFTENPIRIRKVPRCGIPFDDYDIRAQFLCNGKDYIMYTLQWGRGYDFADYGIIRYNKSTGEVDRITNPDGVYRAASLACQTDRIFEFMDKPDHYDENGVFHIGFEREYYNLDRNIKKRLKLPMTNECGEDKVRGGISCLHQDTYVEPFVYNEYVFFDGLIMGEPEEMRDCLWRYDTETDELIPVLCLGTSYYWIQGYSPVSNYILPIEIHYRTREYPAGILLFNTKTFEKRMITDDNSMLRGASLSGNILVYYKMDDYNTYALDIETGVKRRVPLESDSGSEISGPGEIKGKYMITGYGGEYSMYWIVDLEKLGVIKDGHVVPE